MATPPLLKESGWSNYALEESRGDGKKGASTEATDLPDEGYSDGKLAALAVEALEDYSEQDQPFFLAVGFFKPHLPFCAPKKYWELYDYDTDRSATQQGAFLVERENVVEDLAYQELREQLGVLMDQSLAARTDVESLKCQTSK